MLPNEDGLDAMFTFETGEKPAVEQEVFRVLVLGDWVGVGRVGDMKSRSPKFIDRDEFDDVMKDISPEVQIDMSNDRTETLSIGFASIDDFHPDSLFERLPVFEEFRDLRKRLQNSETFNSAATEVKGWISDGGAVCDSGGSTNEVAESSGSLLDEILSGSSSPKSSGDVESLQDLVRELVAPHIVKIDENEQVQMISAVDAAISDLMRKILHSPEFQRLEASWRGMYRLVRKVPTGTELKIYLSQMTKNEFCSDLKSSDDLSKSNLFGLLSGGELGGPWALVCGDYSFVTEVDDIAALIRISKISADVGSPFVTHIDSKCFVTADRESGRIEDVGFGEVDRSEKLWNILRSEESASSLGMMTPRYLGRLPYGNDCDVIETFSFEEFISSPTHDSYLWINPCFLFASLVAQAYSEFGWELYREMQQDVTDLPIHVSKIDGQTLVKPCGEFIMSESSCEALVDLGLMPLVSFKDSDRVRIANLKSVAASGVRLKALWR